MREKFGAVQKITATSKRSFLAINVAGLFVLFFGIAMPALVAGPQTAGETSRQNVDSAKRKPAAESYIVKYYIEEAAPGSTYESGPLHIIYSDGLDVVQKLPMKKESTDTEAVENQEGFSDPQLAEDKKTMGWTDIFGNPGTSYAVPEVLVLYRSGRIIRRIQQGQMVWAWEFVDGGKKVSVVWGTTHGPEVGDFQLYDVNTGRKLSEVFGDSDTQALKPDAPVWAKKLEGHLNNVHQSK
jgi:hypothetical protein